MIYRYLATASAVLLFAALVLIAWFYNLQATRGLIDLTTKHNIAVDRILSNAIWSRYQDYLAEAETLNKDALRSRPETAAIGKAVSTITSGLQILKLKIYGADGRVIFSTQHSEIGEDYSQSEALQAAIRQGRPSSALSYRDRFSAFSGEIFKRDVVETYLPKYDEQGRVIDVFELYSDVTEAKEQIDATTIRLTLGLTVIFLLTYTVLVAGIMRRAIEPVRIASQRAAEIGPAASCVRLPVQGMPKEILPLILAINGALDRLDQALDAQRRFTADAAHEMLTPLALLRAQIEDIDEGPTGRALVADVDAMAGLISQLLELAELEAQGTPVDLSEHADLQQVAAEVISQMAAVAVRDGKEIALSGEERPVLVKGPADLLSRVLRNLIENALRHTPENTAVDVRLGPDGSLRVSDHGDGIPHEKRETVFKRFWRGDRARVGGPGLGLAIVKRAVEAVGGQVWIEDAPSRGACFAVQFEPSGNADDAQIVTKPHGPCRGKPD